MKHANGTYVLNGMHSLQLYNVKIRIGGSTLSYTGSDSGNETVLITGRLKVPLEIQVISIYQAGAPGTQVLWEYYTPLDEDDLARQYGDESSDFHCDRPCQGFKQVKKCFIHGKPYDPIYCSTYNIPFTYEKQPCNDDCVLSWSTPHQQACSSRCGNGYKRVIYDCTKYNTIDGIRERMDENTCRRYVGEKPKDVVECVGDCTGTGWVHGNWGEVSETSFSSSSAKFVRYRFSVSVRRRMRSETRGRMSKRFEFARTFVLLHLRFHFQYGTMCRDGM